MGVLLYIHGFLSSPRSHKAQQTAAWLRENRPDIRFACPALPAHPRMAADVLRSQVEEVLPEPVYLLGSSLGGFYATWLAEHYRLRAVLINPAVAPHRLIADYLDTELQNYHTEERYRLGRDDLQALRELEVEALQYLANLWLMVQTGDETLDYRQAVARYRNCRQQVEEGGDHSFQDFHRHLPAILDFLTGPTQD